MPMFQVQLWVNGKWDGNDYQKVDAPTEKEAAEKLCGVQLFEIGTTYQIRAQVRPLGRHSSAKIFYDRNP